MRSQGERRPRLITPTFLLVTFASFAYFLSYGVSLPVLPHYVDGPLGGGSVAVGLVAGAFSLSAIVFRPRAGRMGDRRGRRILILAGGAIVAATLFVVPVTQSIAAGGAPMLAVAVLFLLRLISGVGEAMMFTGAVTMINDLAPDERRGEALSLFTLSLYGGLALGPLIGELLRHGPGYAAAWLAAGALSAVTVVLGIALPDTRPEGTAGHVPGRLVHPAALAPGTIMAFSVWAFAGFNSFMPLYAERTLRMSGSGAVFLVYSIVIVLVRLFGARIPDVAGEKTSGSLSLAGSVLGLAMIAAWRQPAGLFAGAVIFALGQSLAFPALLSLAVKAAPARERGSVVGTFTAFVDIGFGIGPIVSGAVAALAGYPAVFVSGAGAAALGFVLLQTRPTPGKDSTVADAKI